MQANSKNPFVKIFYSNKELLDEIEVQELIDRATLQKQNIEKLIKQNKTLKKMLKVKIDKL